MARTERKTAPGYRGFVFHTSPEVTLEQDLVRRDLTINAIARAPDGTLVDPFGGQADLKKRIFRHVSDAFLEDPVRILRLARFAARFPDFTVAPETLTLMRGMVDAGEVDALVAERVWQELSRGLMEATPSRMLTVLRDCGALARILPELDALWEQGDCAARRLAKIDHAAESGLALELRFAVLLLDLSVDSPGGIPAALAQITAVCQRLKVPSECRDLALMSLREHAVLAGALALDANAVVALFERCDAFRKPQRFTDMLSVHRCETDPVPLPQLAHLLRALAAARDVDAGAVARLYESDRGAIPGAVRAARVAAVRLD